METNSRAMASHEVNEASIFPSKFTVTGVCRRWTSRIDGLSHLGAFEQVTSAVNYAG